jgi:hypothetical protein
MKPQRVLVTGCARSGTGYAAALLSRLGLPCGHERLFAPDTVRDRRGGWGALPRWPPSVPAESSWLAAPFIERLAPGTLVVHLVRHPLAVVRSNLRIGFFHEPTDYLDFARAHLPGPERGSPLAQAARYWVGWNALIERAIDQRGLAYMRLRLEDVDERSVRELLVRAGHAVPVEEVRSALSEVPRDTNTRGRRRDDSGVRLEQLPTGPLREALAAAARRYGYADVAAPLPRGRLPQSLTLF